MRSRRVPWVLAAALVAVSSSSALATPAAASAQALPQGRSPQALSTQQKRDFLLTAKVIKSRQGGKGVTLPFRLTLTDGTLTHDASFSTVDERALMKVFSDGTREVNFVDSYRYNIAAYELAVLLGLGDMMPVTVERTWRAMRGSLSWWVDDVMMDEGERRKAGTDAPDPPAWNAQVHRLRVFSQLVYDTDRNVGNLLITRDWRLWMIDFTRAFRRTEGLESDKGLVQCDRQLLQRLRQLSRGDVEAAVGRHLTRQEIDAVMARRDLIVAHFERLIAERGEAMVLY